MTDKPQTLAEQIRALAIPDDFTDEEATGYWQATHDAAALAAATTTPVVVAEQAGDVRQAWRVRPLVWDADGFAHDELLNTIWFYTDKTAQERCESERQAKIMAHLEPDPTPALGWRAMQTAAAEACDKRGAQEQRDYGLDRAAQNCFRCRDDVRALPGPTDEQALSEAVRLPQWQAMREVLEWYGEQSRLCRLIHSEGDAGRNALARDGGKKAETALATLRAERDALANPPPWEDRDDALTYAVNASHPVHSGDYDNYVKALELVSNRHSKGALVALVCHLLRAAKEPMKGGA